MSTQDFSIKATLNTPEIIGESELGKVTISGKCYPENAIAFFEPINKWLDEFFEGSHESFNLVLDLEYFNTASSILLLDIMKRFSDMNRTKEITWLFEKDDLDMQEAGNEYSLILGDHVQVKEKNARA